MVCALISSLDLAACMAAGLVVESSNKYELICKDGTKKNAPIMAMGASKFAFRFLDSDQFAFC